MENATPPESEILETTTVYMTGITVPLDSGTATAEISGPTIVNQSTTVRELVNQNAVAENRSSPVPETENKTLPTLQSQQPSCKQASSEATSLKTPPFSGTTCQLAPPSETTSEGVTSNQTTLLSVTNQTTPFSDESINQNTPPQATNEAVMLKTAPPSEMTNQKITPPNTTNDAAAENKTLPPDSTNQSSNPITSAADVDSPCGPQPGDTPIIPTTTTASTEDKEQKRPRRRCRSSRSFRNALTKRNSARISPAVMREVELPEYIWYHPSGVFKCVVCDDYGFFLSSLTGVKTHCQGQRHQMQATKARQTSSKDAPKLKITSTGRYDYVFRAHSLSVPLDQGTSEMTFTLCNVSQDRSLRFLGWHGPYLNGEVRYLQPTAASLGGSQKIALQPAQSIDLTLQITPQEETTLSFKVHFRLEDLGKKVDSTRYASVVENVPVRIYVVGEHKKKTTPMDVGKQGGGKCG